MLLPELVTVIVNVQFMISALKCVFIVLELLKKGVLPSMSCRDGL